MALGSNSGAMVRVSESEYESTHTDPEEETGSDVTARPKRQQSVPEMLRAQQHKEPRAAKRQRQASGKTGKPSEASAITLEAIEALIEAGNAKIIETIEAKFSSVERRLEVVEVEVFDKNARLECLEREMIELREQNARLREQLEGIDTNRRLNSLIFHSKEFGEPSRAENIEEKLIAVLNRHMPEIDVDKADFVTVHRLYGSDKVIAKFQKTGKRDKVYERRFELAKIQAGRRNGNPLYISESLSQGRREIFNITLEAKRKEKVQSVFTRRGIVYIKTSRDAEPQKIDDLQKARELLRGSPRQTSSSRSDGPGRQGHRPIPTTVTRGSGGPPGKAGAGAGREGGGEERVPDRGAPAEDRNGGAGETRKPDSGDVRGNLSSVRSEDFRSTETGGKQLNAAADS